MAYTYVYWEPYRSNTYSNIPELTCTSTSTTEKKQDVKSIHKRISYLEKKVLNLQKNDWKLLWTNKDMWGAFGIGVVIGMVTAIFLLSTIWGKI